MSDVKTQYEAFPYPERDPKDELKRLITGSPSHPLELDHHLFGGLRDWSGTTRILVAGGGTGDALVQLAQVLTSAGKKYEITYIDLSSASREIAEARAKVRGLSGITFITGSLLDAANYGPFDYIDCCGVLHHLPDPQEGFDALAKALAPDGGLGLMVYAPYGRSGVYPLQEAFGQLTKGLTPKEQLTQAKAVFEKLPESHPFKRNTHLVDHKQSDAGFYDLLLHSQDRPYTIEQLAASLAASGLQLAGVPQPYLYQLDRFTPRPDGLDDIAAMALAEKLDGTIKTHVVYAKPAGAACARAGQTDRAVPHLKGVGAAALAQAVAAKGRIPVTLNGIRHSVELPKASASILAGIDGRRDIAALRKGAGLDALAWAAIWPKISRALEQFGLLVYSRLLV
ncbi:class I SAM-dependent methyltransferase [Litoreibacter arenae]|uniref:3-demethylubiquinone-9 3-methyltransferase n=1 Tax=Litoreibacter arenae DSM 19593 TaxID=1123360 RepID=S9QCK7_9RHOB|nr:class I SAM-dependent methyltransferase [Litoreibacter arenae]EPX79141.1 3-demethylubiquinone-9 3-methyltransferase [Litoreibacter arenae DSM 19593]